MTAFDTLSPAGAEVLALAQAVARRNAFRSTLLNYGGGGVRITPPEPGQTWHRRWAEVMSYQVAAASNGTLTTTQARRQLNKLVETGHLVVKPTCGGCNHYQLPPDSVDGWFAEAVAFYTEAGLSTTEIRCVQPPPIPELPR